MAQGDDATPRVTERLSEIVWLMDAELEEVRYVDRTDGELTSRETHVAGSGLDSLDLVHAEDRQAFREWLDGIRADVAAGDVEDRYDDEFRLVDPEGTERLMTTTLMPVREDGAVTAFAGVSVDVTAQVDRERELRERIERLDDFASMVSHDLRNPLSIAHGHLDLFRETREDEYLDRIEESLSRIEELAGEMLALARASPEAGTRRAVAIGSVAEAAWAATDTRDASLVCADDLEIDASEEQLRLLLENLFRNAVGHGGDGVTVRIGAVADGFYIEDTGRGIPPEERERVFEHGYTTGYAGSGVGLTVVQRVAEAHGWEVSLAESEEGGARFEFRGVGPADGR